jgi:hypothetical protein
MPRRSGRRHRIFRSRTKSAIPSRSIPCYCAVRPWSPSTAASGARTAT